MAPSVFDYADYRTFLRDYHARRKNRPGWSLLVWARSLSLKSPSTLLMIMQGSRNPGSELVDSLCSYFRFNAKEADYFTNLVRLGKCKKDIRLSVLLMEQLSRSTARGAFAQVSHEHFSAIANWHYYAIREMVGLPKFRENASWLSQQFRFALSPKQIKQAIATLLSLGLLERDSRGKLRATSAHVNTRNDFADEGLKRFHEGALENAKLAVRRTLPGEREFQGCTFALCASQLPKAKAMLRRFQDEFCDAFESGKGDSVYHLELAFFPLITFSPGDSRVH